jgi:hypothetical protein
MDKVNCSGSKMALFPFFKKIVLPLCGPKCFSSEYHQAQLRPTLTIPTRALYYDQVRVVVH